VRDDMNPLKIVTAATAVVFLLAIIFGGVIAYLSLGFFLTWLILMLAMLISGPGRGAKVPPEHLFEESLEFSKLNPHSDNERRHLLAQKVSRRIDKGLVLSKSDTAKADAGDYELDRIGLYVWEGVSGLWPQERCVHLRDELTLVKASRNSPSLMALEYALASFQKAVDQGRAGLTTEEIDLLAAIHDYMNDHLSLDGATGILAEVDGMLSAKPAKPAVTSQAAPPSMLAAYKTIREARLQELAKKRATPLRVTSLQVFMNLNDNGDAIINERYEVVSSEGDPIHFLPTNLPADYSFVPDALQYEDKPAGQSIEWKFDVEGALSGKARVFFNPPIGTNPISYSRHWTRFNAVYFNQRDREDSGFPGSTEEMSFPVRYRYDKLSFRITFPKRIHPARFNVLCKPLQESEPAPVDEDESAWAASGIDWDEKEGVVWLNVSDPLPGHSYHLVWDLPPVDADELTLTPWQSNIAKELNGRFLSLRESSAPVRGQALGAMTALASELQSRFGDDLHLRLFAYRSENGKGGLIEVLEGGGAAVSPELVTIGRTLVGRSFRRKRSILRYQSIELHEQDKSFEKIPSEADRERPCVAVAIPLLCPQKAGRRVGVLYVSTWARDTNLIQVGRAGADTDFFAAKVVHWYANELCNAVNMKGILQTAFEQPDR